MTKRSSKTTGKPRTPRGQRIIKLQLERLLTDPHPYKPYSPHLVPPEEEPLFVEFHVPVTGIVERLSGGGHVLNKEGFQKLLEDVGATILWVQLTEVE